MDETKRLKNKRQKKKRIEINGSYIRNKKRDSHCKICGGSGKYVQLEFHHINREEKFFDISRRLNYSHDRVKREIKKCELLCSGCHKWYERRYGAYKPKRFREKNEAGSKRDR